MGKTVVGVQRSADVGVVILCGLLCRVEATVGAVEKAGKVLSMFCGLGAGREGNLEARVSGRSRVFPRSVEFSPEKRRFSTAFGLSLQGEGGWQPLFRGCFGL